jgi:ribosomal protein S17E
MKNKDNYDDNYEENKKRLEKLFDDDSKNDVLRDP